MKPSEEIVRFFEKDRFAAETGAVIDEIDDRYARCSLTLEAKHKNALGAVMGHLPILRLQLLQTGRAIQWYH